jgi:hypothetical protein
MRSLISQAEVCSGMVFAMRLRASGSIPIKTDIRSGLRRNRRCAVHGVLRRFDPSLTLTRTQYPAIVGKTENTKPFVYARFAIVCNAQQPLTDHS